MNSRQSQQCDRQGHMQQQPAVQPVVEPFLFQELGAFEAECFQPGYFVGQLGRQSCGSE